jgi:hypothetical protein
MIQSQVEKLKQSDNSAYQKRLSVDWLPFLHILYTKSYTKSYNDKHLTKQKGTLQT